MRQPLERRGDFNAMYGTGRKAVEHVQRLCRRFGKKDLLEAIDEILARLRDCHAKPHPGPRRRRLLRRGIHGESTGTSPEPLVLRLKLSVKGDRLIADYTGTSPQTAGPTNVGPAMTMTSLCTIVKSFLDPGTPVNHGSFEPIEIISRVRHLHQRDVPRRLRRHDGGQDPARLGGLDRHGPGGPGDDGRGPQGGRQSHVHFADRIRTATTISTCSMNGSPAGPGRRKATTATTACEITPKATSTRVHSGRGRREPVPDRRRPLRDPRRILRRRQMAGRLRRTPRCPGQE